MGLNVPYASTTISSTSEFFSLMVTYEKLRLNNGVMSELASTNISYNNTTFNDTSIHTFKYTEWNNSIHNKLMNDTNCPSIQMPLGNLISMILYSIVFMIGLCGNTLVIYVVLRFSKMQTVTNMYILNLAIADECFLIGIPFLLVTMHLGGWTFGKGMCKIYMVSTSITQFTSSIFLFIMSADRYVAVCHPISSTRYRSPFVSRIVSTCAWTASALIMLPVMLYANTIKKDERSHRMSCIIEWPHEHEESSGSTFTLYSLILGFAIPLCLILVFYYLVLRKLRTVGPKSKSREKKRSHRKVTKLVLTVIAVYIMCWLPYWISQVALINSSPDTCQSRLEVTIFILVGCLGYSNSAMNPILYAFLSDNFKKSFLKACACANGRDVNNQLQAENSFFPRFGRKGSEKCYLSSKSSVAVRRNTKSNQFTAGNDAISESVQTKSTAVSIYKGKPDNANERPPILHTDF